MSYPRTPGRWLGPLALAIALVAVLAIITSTTGTKEAESPRETSTAKERERGDSERKEQPAREEETTSTGADGETETTPEKKTYTVQPGDTLAGIAEETGVAIEELERLNPGIDSSSLSIGQEIRLAR